MLVESVMYFALGALAASLLALLIVPAVWRRAVRLTKKRIEAVTPMTLSEFRADKDQLRAEFALSTRRLEMNVEALRKRLADQLADINRKKTDMSLLKNERDQHAAIMRELEQREADARRRVLELEKEAADLAQRLRMRDREYANRVAEVQELRNPAASRIHQPPQVEGHSLIGDYDADVAQLAAALAAERQRAGFLEHQARSLIARLDGTDRQAFDARAAVVELRDSLASQDAATKAADLSAAEAQLASAESQLNALLEETGQLVPDVAAMVDGALPALAANGNVETLRGKVFSLERMILSSWGTDTVDHNTMRSRLGDIAADVSELVYAAALTAAVTPDSEVPTLFDRVQKFAEGGSGNGGDPVQPAAPEVVDDSAVELPRGERRA